MLDNKHLKHTLEFDEADAPVIMRAFSLAAATAMMCGHPGAKKKMQAYQAMMVKFVPDAAKHFDEEVWCEIGIALASATRFEVTLCKDGWHNHHWVREGRVSILVDGRRFDAEGIDRYRFGDPILQQVFDAIRDLAPMDCEAVLATKFADVEDAA
jgi:hypothetical protein